MKKKTIILIITIGIIPLLIIVSIIIFLQESHLIIPADYNNLSLTPHTIEITNDEIQNQIKNKLANFVVAEERSIVQEGFLVVLDYSTYINQAKVAEKYEQSAYIGSGFFGEEFEQKLIGANINEELIFDISFPNDYEDSTLAGYDYSFRVYIHRIVEYVYPELSDSFVKTNLGYDSVDAFLQMIYEEIQSTELSKSFNRYKTKVFSELIEKSIFYLNEDEVISIYKVIVDYYTQNALYVDMDVYSYAYHTMHMNKVEFIDHCKQESIYYIKSVLLSTHIANKEKITISDTDISEYCNNNNIYFEGDVPSEYLSNLILIDKIQNYIVE